MDKDKVINEDDFIKQNPTLFKKYKINKKLAEGAFGDVYTGNSIDSNEPVAIKVELKKIAKPLLETEAYFLFALRGIGIPEVLSFGRRKNYNILVEPLLGKSLFDIFNERRKHMALGDICLIAKQILDRIQWVHSKGFVHRDIKPDNFLIGRKDPNVIYLIDFGLSKKYKSDKTGKHLKFGFTGKLTGTVRFASANALRGGEQSRRDDLESIAYMIIFFMRGKLPWQGVQGTKKMERYLKIYKMKKNVTPEDLCKSLPSQMVSFVKYVKQLEFEQEPDYNYLRSLFQSILKQRKMNFDSLVFSWIKMEDLKKLKDPINPATRKESPQGRLLKKIETKLKNERNNSSDNDSGQRSFQTANAFTQDKEENFTSKDEAEFEYSTYKNKKEKSKEGLNTLMANLNTSLDENVNFDDTEKKENIKKEELKKKNYTVNDTLDFKTEIKISKNIENYASIKNKDIIRDKSEEIRLSNCNERKMNLMEIDEKEEKNIKNEELKNNENNINKKEDKKEPTNKEIKDEEKKDSNKEIKNNYNSLGNQNPNIIPIKKGKIHNDYINNINNQKILNNNINLINKNIISESPEKIDNINNNINLNLIKMKRENENNKQNKIKLENKKDENNMNNVNIIKMKKKTGSPDKNIAKMNKKNLDNINKILKDKKQNKNIIIKKGINLDMDTKNIQMKNQPKNHRINIKTQKIKIDKRPIKLITENDEGPMDNKNNNFITIREKKPIFNKEINNTEINSNSSKNVDKFINNIKLKNRHNNTERRHTPNNISNMNQNMEENTFKKNISTFGNEQNFDSDLLPKNSDELINNSNEKFDKDNINFNNNDNIKVKKFSNSVNLFPNDDIYFNNNNINSNNKNNINFNSNIRTYNRTEERLDTENNNVINNFVKTENNNNLYSNNNIYDNNENLRNIEFNANRKIRIVNRNKNQSKNIKTYNVLNNPNTNGINLYNTFTNSTGNNNINNSNYKPHNININNHINNNIIINNNITSKYSQPMNSSFRSNSNNPYSNKNMISQNYILSKRPSHNINSSKLMRSFNIYTNVNDNLNQIQYMKRPSYNIKSYNNNNFNPMSHIIVGKRPSYNSNFSVSNFLNNTEPNNTHKGNIKIKKLTNKNDMSGNIQMAGKHIEILTDNKDIKNRGLRIEFGEDNHTQILNNTYENNNSLTNQYKLNNNFNNNMMINKGNNLNNSYKLIGLSDKRVITPLSNVNYPMSQNYGDNNNTKITTEKIPNYKNNYQNKIVKFQNFNNQFDNKTQYYGFSNY